MEACPKGINPDFWPPKPVTRGTDPSTLERPIQPLLLLKKVYFHNKNCQTPREMRPSALTDAETNPCGGLHKIKSFPLDIIVRSTYDNILARIHSSQDLITWVLSQRGSLPQSTQVVHSFCLGAVTATWWHHPASFLGIRAPGVGVFRHSLCYSYWKGCHPPFSLLCLLE